MAVALENFLEQILILSCLLDDAHDTDFMILNLLATQVYCTLHLIKARHPILLFFKCRFHIFFLENGADPCFENVPVKLV